MRSSSSDWVSPLKIFFFGWLGRQQVLIWSLTQWSWHSLQFGHGAGPHLITWVWVQLSLTWVELRNTRLWITPLIKSCDFKYIMKPALEEKMFYFSKRCFKFSKHLDWQNLWWSKYHETTRNWKDVLFVSTFPWHYNIRKHHILLDTKKLHDLNLNARKD